MRRLSVELGWGAFAAASFAAMLAWPRLQTVPFHFIWISLAVVYGFRVWPVPATAAVVLLVTASTGALFVLDSRDHVQLAGDLATVPLLGAMFMAMVWHARRRVAALRLAERRADEQRAVLEREERFVQDASHELRTPLTIARGHLETLTVSASSAGERAIILEELARMDAILARLLTLAATDAPAFVQPVEIDIEPYLEELFMRWCEVAPRAWRLGMLAPGRLRADPDRLRTALDALLENAVKYTREAAIVELAAYSFPDGCLHITVRDTGAGIPAQSLTQIFERFSRADAARERTTGGVGLGLAIVDAITRAHGGSCTAHSGATGTMFTLRLPGFTPVQRRALAA